MALVHLNFESKFLRFNTDVNIILPNRDRETEPAQFYDLEKKYPVLWLLHGAMGDYTDWVRKSNIETYACERDLIVVMPSGLNSYYGNWPHYSGGLWYPRYIFEELMPLVYAWFPASQEREDNFIGGLSMGGQGTIKYVFMHPEKFAAGCALSAPAIEYRAKYAEEAGTDRHAHSDYVDANGGLEPFLQSGEDARHTIEACAGEGKLREIPPLYFGIGGNDPRRQETEEFLTWLDGLGLHIDLHTIEGYVHEWRYWDQGIDQALEFFAELNPKLAKTKVV